MKECNICHEVKPFSDFHRSLKAKDGRQGGCKPCRNTCRRGLQKKNAPWRRAQEKAYREKFPDKCASSRLLHLYGITLEEYEVMLARQGGKCAICFAPPSGDRRLDVDHCHNTGVIRGLLCRRCNTALGKMDSTETLASAIAYLNQGVLLAA